MATILVYESKPDRNFGGAEISMASYLDVLISEGHRIPILSEATVVDYPGTSFFVAGVPPSLRSPISAILWVRRVVRVLKITQPDVVFTHCTHCLFHLSLACWLSDTPLKVYFKWIPANRQTPLSYRFLRIFPLEICANSVGVQDFWHKRLNLSCRLFYNGINTQHQIGNTQVERRIGNIRCAYLGRVSSEKGVHLLLHAVLNDPNLDLSVVGAIEDRFIQEHSDLCQKARECDRIVFHGYQKKPLTLLPQSHLVICPSVADEAGPRSAMEGMFLGIPTAVSNQCGASKEFGPLQSKLIFEPNLVGIQRMLEYFGGLSVQSLDDLVEEQIDVVNNVFSSKKTYNSLNEFLSG